MYHLQTAILPQSFGLFNKFSLIARLFYQLVICKAYHFFFGYHHSTRNFGGLWDMTSWLLSLFDIYYLGYEILGCFRSVRMVVSAIRLLLFALVTLASYIHHMRLSYPRSIRPKYLRYVRFLYLLLYGICHFYHMVLDCSCFEILVIFVMRSLLNSTP